MSQFPQVAQVTLESCQLRGRGMVGLSQSMAGVGLFLPQSGAERQQQVTGQQLDHLQETTPFSEESTKITHHHNQQQTAAAAKGFPGNCRNTHSWFLHKIFQDNSWWCWKTASWQLSPTAISSLNVTWHGHSIQNYCCLMKQIKRVYSTESTIHDKGGDSPGPCAPIKVKISTLNVQLEGDVEPGIMCFSWPAFVKSSLLQHVSQWGLPNKDCLPLCMLRYLFV